jgi:hypothetical protein
MTDPEFTVGVLATPALLQWQEVALRNALAIEGVTVEHVVVDASVRDDSSTFTRGVRAVNRDRSLSLADLELFYDTLREEKLKALVYADRKLGWELFGDVRGRRWIRSRPVESVDVLSDARFHDANRSLPAGTGRRSPGTLPQRWVPTVTSSFFSGSVY